MRLPPKSFLLILTVSGLLLSGAFSGSTESKNPWPNESKKPTAEKSDSADYQEQQEFLSILRSEQAAFLDAIRTVQAQTEATNQKHQPENESWNTPSMLVQIGLLVVGVLYTIFAA